MSPPPAPSTAPGASRRERSLLRRGGALIGRALRGSPRYFTLGAVSAGLFAGMTILSSVVLGRVTDRVILPAFADERADTGLLWLAAAVVLGVGLLKAIGVVGRRLGAYFAMYDLQVDFRQRVTQRYLDLPIVWHRRHSTGELMSNANSDVEEAFRVSAPLPMAFAAVIMLLITTVLLIVADPSLAAIGIGVLPTIAIANYVYQGRMRAAATLAQQSRADVSEVAHESVDAALVVKTLGREGAETRRFEAQSQRLRDRMIQVGRLRGTFDPVLEALPNIGILLVLVVGVTRVGAGALTPGDLVQFAYLFQLLAVPMRAFGWVLGDLPRGVVGLERVDRVLASTGDPSYGAGDGRGTRGADVRLRGVGYRHPVTGQDRLDTDAPALDPAALEGSAVDPAALDGSAVDPAALDGSAVDPATLDAAAPDGTHGNGHGGAFDEGAALDEAAADGTHGEPIGDEGSRRVGEVAATGAVAAATASATDHGRRGVHDVRLELPPGRTVAVVGPTGAGKSTLASLLVRLIDPDVGRVDLDGQDLADLARDRLPDTVAIVFQEAFLFDESVRDNITLGAEFSDDEVVTAARISRAHGFVTALGDGYDTRVGERGSTLSGGQRQRIALARALIRRPRLLVLDDATSAVDPSVETDILHGLADADLPATVAIVAYRQSSIALADAVAYVEDGEVRALGSHDQLLADQPGYARLVTAYERDAHEHEHEDRRRYEEVRP